MIVIRGKILTSVSRKYFLTKQDIRNIKAKVDDRIVKRHEDDASSVSMMVAELQQEAYDLILIFKPQGKRDEEHGLPEEAFVLAIQTQFQRELYQKFAVTIMCIDSTHGTNQYRFKLISVVVPDDQGKGTKSLSIQILSILKAIALFIGQPVGWCISDSETSVIIKIFLEHMKARSPNTIIRTLMTDDGNFIILVVCA